MTSSSSGTSVLQPTALQESSIFAAKGTLRLAWQQKKVEVKRGTLCEQRRIPCINQGKGGKLKCHNNVAQFYIVYQSGKMRFNPSCTSIEERRYTSVPHKLRHKSSILHPDFRCGGTPAIRCQLHAWEGAVTCCCIDN
eukprot:scaffold47317_cov18-Tisochrysis_lutea.AAC.1